MKLFKRNIAMFVAYIITLIWVTIMFWVHIDTKPTNPNIADEIKACFDDVDFSGQSFINGGTTIADSSGETVFYRKSQIDKAINCLNKLMSDLRINATPNKSGLTALSGQQKE